MEFNSLLATLAGLSGFAAFVAAFVNIGKSIGFVKDGTAANWSAGINLVGLIALFVTGVVGVDLDLIGIDAQLAAFAEIALVIFGYITQLIGSKVFHEALRWVKAPFIGKSNS